MKLSERPTPLTDAACVSREFIAREMDIYSHKFVLADHARSLERRLSVAVEALEFYAKTDRCDIAQMTLREISKEKP